ncbi:unnamed protein product [Oncorhynchus mykiss]|uniref:Uncharacterized protein n=1 Tax=Oncorhynchus mykiss TaxID=8022 RepID=A0A060Y6Z9_ONCMY|nr:unnamed protein product [Oncorhynchus mykiss]
MDITTAVFNAARDGKLKLIQKLLSNKIGSSRRGENAGRHTSPHCFSTRTLRGCGLFA